MILSRAVYKNSVWFFVILLASAIWGFWPNYFSNPLQEPDIQVHFHGITLTLWCVMLVSQAYLIRSDRRRLHRAMGRTSYLLAPLVVISTFIASHHAMETQPAGLDLALFAIILSGPVLFAVAYGLAIYNRKDPATHARFMLCTPLPMIGPIFNRVLVFYFPSYVGFMPMRPNNVPFVQPITLIAMDAILAFLAVWDWRSHRRLNVFPMMFGLFVVVQLLIFWLYDQPFWVAFTRWFLEQPFS